MESERRDTEFEPATAPDVVAPAHSQATDDASEATNYQPPSHDPFAALRVGAFRLWMVGNVTAVLGMQMQSTAIGWEIFDRTRNYVALAMVGLVQVVPVILFALPAGQIADRVDRRWMLIGALGLASATSAMLALLSMAEGPVSAIFACLFLAGTSRSLIQPAKSSFLPRLVPASLFPNAVTWSMGGFQFAAALGPALAGWLIYQTESASTIYWIHAAASLVFIATLALMSLGPVAGRSEPVSLDSLLGGARYLWHRPLLMSAILLDMFAVLLGGAVALLPAFAREILDVGASGLGWMRAAPAIGAVVMSLLLAFSPPLKRAGPALLWSVIGFGVATIVFGFSRNFGLSLAALIATGVFDTVSVVVRHSLIQLHTPDEMRGRVSALNGMCIGISNELGEFESGVVAYWIGPVGSVVAGGCGTILVVAIVALAYPELRRYGRLGSRGIGR